MYEVRCTDANQAMLEAVTTRPFGICARVPARSAQAALTGANKHVELHRCVQHLKRVRKVATAPRPSTADASAVDATTPTDAAEPCSIAEVRRIIGSTSGDINGDESQSAARSMVYAPADGQDLKASLLVLLGLDTGVCLLPPPPKPSDVSTSVDGNDLAPSPTTAASAADTGGAAALCGDLVTLSQTHGVDPSIAAVPMDGQTAAFSSVLRAFVTDAKHCVLDLWRVPLPLTVPDTRPQWELANAAWPQSLPRPPVLRPTAPELFPKTHIAAIAAASDAAWRCAAASFSAGHLRVGAAVVDLDSGRVVAASGNSLARSDATAIAPYASTSPATSSPEQAGVTAAALEASFDSEEYTARVPRRPGCHAVMEAIRGVDWSVLDPPDPKSADVEEGTDKRSRSVDDDDDVEVAAPAYGPASHLRYLCTGLAVVSTHEPCCMCTMALVHGRAAKVFFSHRNAANGALASHYAVHTISSLNHRFLAYGGVPPPTSVPAPESPIQ